MRILAATPYYEPEGGGLERYAHAILSRLAARGHTVEVLAATRAEAKDFIRDGVHVTLHRPRTFLGNAPIDPGLPRRIRDRIRTARPDVIVGHAPVPFPAEIACREARRADIPFVLTYHAGRLRGSSPMLDVAATLARWTVERRMFAASKGLIAVSDFVRDNALLAHRDRVTIIPPGVDEAAFRPGVETPHEILFVGPLARAYRWKGVDVLTDAFHQVRQEFPRATLRLVGHGDRLPAFEALAAHSQGSIEISGRLDDAQLIAAYQRAGVVVLPSITDAEAFGMVLAEANACGRPVIGSRLGGIPDFIRDGVNGSLAEPGDATDLANKILDILRSPERAEAMGRAGREQVLARHRWGPLAEQTEHVLQAATGAD